eukprot:Opistho-1_new@73563
MSSSDAISASGRPPGWAARCSSRLSPRSRARLMGAPFRNEGRLSNLERFSHHGPRMRAHERHRLHPQRPQPEPARGARAARVRQHHAGRGRAAVPARVCRAGTALRISPVQPRGRAGGLGAGGAREGRGGRGQSGRPVVPLDPAARRAQDAGPADRGSAHHQHPPPRSDLPAVADLARGHRRDLRLRRLRLRAGDPRGGAAPGHRRRLTFTPNHKGDIHHDRSPQPAQRPASRRRARRRIRHDDLGASPAHAAFCRRVLGQGHPRRHDEDVRQGHRGRFQARGVPQLHAVPPGHRAGGAAARQPRDGQHRAAGHLQADPGLVAAHLRLPVPRRQPPDEFLRQRHGRADEEDGRGPAQGEDPRPDLLRHPAGRPQVEEEDQRAGRPGRREAAHAAGRQLAVAGPVHRRQPHAHGLR